MFVSCPRRGGGYLVRIYKGNKFIGWPRFAEKEKT